MPVMPLQVRSRSVAKLTDRIASLKRRHRLTSYVAATAAMLSSWRSDPQILSGNQRATKASVPSAGPGSAQVAGQLDEPELPVAADQTGAVLEEVGEELELGQVALPVQAIVDDRRSRVVEQQVVADEEVRDAGRPGAGAEFGGAARGAHVLGERVVLEDEVGEVGPLEVVGVAPHVDEPHALRRRQALVDQLVVGVVIEPPREIGRRGLPAEDRPDGIELGEPREDDENAGRG